METLVLQSVLFLLATFGTSAVLGWMIAGPKRKARLANPAIDWSTAEVIDMPAPKPAAVAARSQPVSYLDAAAEHFTTGVTPKPHVSEGPAYIPFNPAQEVAQPGALLHPHMEDDFGSVRRVSSLATMTPESVEAAVQQAGSGLEPVRLRAPQGPIDDLTVISGITGDQQKQLNELGVYHFWQIAGWTPEHVAWVAHRLPSWRRIARENW
ncbi:MAG: hypothetical protein JF615_13615, partial [Asticcacaulis sp.]|nr:hypothetical protein [Asticcacaulis sp.]